MTVTIQMALNTTLANTCFPPPRSSVTAKHDSKTSFNADNFSYSAEFNILMWIFYPFIVSVIACLFSNRERWWYKMLVAAGLTCKILSEMQTVSFQWTLSAQPNFLFCYNITPPKTR